MTKTTHTPGPWIKGRGQIFSHTTDALVADILPVSPVETLDTIAEEAANAHLIIAAPDMLAALMDVYPLIIDDAIRARIGRLIMKAMGEP